MKFFIIINKETGRNWRASAEECYIYTRKANCPVPSNYRFADEAGRPVSRVEIIEALAQQTTIGIRETLSRNKKNV